MSLTDGFLRLFRQHRSSSSAFINQQDFTYYKVIVVVNIIIAYFAKPNSGFKIVQNNFYARISHLGLVQNLFSNIGYRPRISSACCIARSETIVKL